MVKNYFCFDTLTDVNSSIESLINQLNVKQPFSEAEIRYFCNQIEINITRLKLTAQLLTTPKDLEDEYLF